MLLKSSSTPLLGSLLPPAHHHDAVGRNSPFAFHYCNSTLSFSPAASLHSSPSFSDHYRGVRRTHSEGNLNTLSHASDAIDAHEHEHEHEHEHPFSFDSFNFKPSNKHCHSHRPTRSILQTIPSFSFYGSTATAEEEDDEHHQHVDPQEEEDDDDEHGHFRIHNRMGMDATVATPEVRAMEQVWTTVSSQEGIGFVGDLQKEMYLTRGLGIGGAGGGGGGGGGGGQGRRGCGGGGGGGGEQLGMEEYYRKMVVDNPGNALVLSNFAEFLYKWKGDLRGAEEYYSRAILIDSQDGEILSKYANFVWELHHDQPKASSYFQRALQASPHDSHVQAAYANFLWKTEEEDDEHSLGKEMATQTYMAAATLSE